MTTTETREETLSKADAAVVHILRRVQSDPRLAWYIGPCSESLHLLLEAAAELVGRDVGDVRAEFEATLRTERPRCAECPHCAAAAGGG